MMYGRPVKSYSAQDHDAHIAVHQSMMQDPTMMPQSPQVAQMIAGSIASHIQEHTAHKYRIMISAQSGTQLPPAPEYDRANPGKDENYEEIDKRLRKEFPHKFDGGEQASSKPVQTVASASRTSGAGRKTVRLTPSQVAIAKKLGVPLEEYAKYVKE